MSVIIREMHIQDYDAVLALWQASEGIGLSDADVRDNIARYLERNPNLSFVAYANGQLVGAVLCGHDGRRGFLHHLAVNQAYRRQGIGRALTHKCLTGLKQAGIDKCHLFVFGKNEIAINFWKDIGWTQRVDLVLMSRHTG
ncbi:MAG: GNAT family N-acetyltransferase [Chloroflexi bacterium RBG_16_57_9]|nr:MAG: GNAT family N-acetyltransferase [Chloroflexi bacterium RBG_16_57_9]